MKNNYVKVAVYSEGRVTSQTIQPFDDRDPSEAARVAAGALSIATFTGGTASVFRHVPGLDLPVVGKGGGFS